MIKDSQSTRDIASILGESALNGLSAYEDAIRREMWMKEESFRKRYPFRIITQARRDAWRSYAICKAEIMMNKILNESARK